MGVVPIVAIIFIETLIVLFGLFGFFVLFKEFRQDSRKFRLWTAIAFLAAAVSYASYFIGQMLYVFGRQTILVLLSVFVYLLIAYGTFLFLATVDLYIVRKKGLWIVFGLLAAAVSLGILIPKESHVMDLDGLIVLHVTAVDLVASHLWLVIASLILVIVSGRKFMRDRKGKREKREADLYFLISGVFLLAFMGISGAMSVVDLGALILPAYLFFFLHMIALVFAAIAKDHEDVRIRKNPLNYVRGGIAMKTVGLVSLLFILLSFLLVMVTANYFVRSSNETREAAIRIELDRQSADLERHGTNLIRKAEHLASLRALSEALAADDALAVADAVAGAGIYAESLQVFDAAGEPFFDGVHDGGVFDCILTSCSTLDSLQGMTHLTIERDDQTGAWVLIAGAPVYSEEDRQVGAVVVASASLLESLSGRGALTVMSSSHGFVTAGSRTVYESGETTDRVTIDFFERQLAGGFQSEGRTHYGDPFYLIEVAPTGVGQLGFFYAVVSHQLINQGNLRILSVLVLLILLIVLAIVVVLGFSVTVILKPVKDLREATSKMESGDYSTRVICNSPDELGDLSCAFNKMAGTIQEKNEGLSKALKQERAYLDNTAHEMRTPLNIFRWTLEMLRFGDAGKLNKEQMELVEQLHQTNQRLYKFVNNLLDMSRMDRGVLEVKRECLHVEDIIDEVAGLFSVRIHEKNLIFHWQRPEPALPQVCGDKERIFQILSNLIGNAVKYTHDNGHIEIRMVQSKDSGPSKRRGKYIVVSIEDNGIGIPKSEQEKVFSRFFRSKSLAGTDVEGTGIGLAITKSLVELQGGEIWFKSDKDKGSVFSFSLPIDSK